MTNPACIGIILLPWDYGKLTAETEFGCEMQLTSISTRTHTPTHILRDANYREQTTSHVPTHGQGGYGHANVSAREDRDVPMHVRHVHFVHIQGRQGVVHHRLHRTASSRCLCRGPCHVLHPSRSGCGHAILAVCSSCVGVVRHAIAHSVRGTCVRVWIIASSSRVASIRVSICPVARKLAACVDWRWRASAMPWPSAPPAHAPAWSGLAGLAPADSDRHTA
mmetsp:Transcript_11067/g.19199  ORF Transcript_11067/g.19199 Transcript_11067/m.19199 type:complete len:222 (-) Transcript_11067:716-1381(-)